MFCAIRENKVWVKSLVMELVPLDGWTDLRIEHDDCLQYYNIAITCPHWGYEDWGCPLGDTRLWSLLPEDDQSKLGANLSSGTRTQSGPNMGQMGEEGAVKWTLLHYPSHVTSGDGHQCGHHQETFSRILFWWSPRIQNKSVKVPIIHAPLQTTSIYPHIRDLCLG